MKTHSIFSKFKKWKGIIPANYVADFTGAIISTHFIQGWDIPGRNIDRYFEADYPPVNEDFFEYISLLQSIAEAAKIFTMIELGAGYGRWIVSAAKASEQNNNLQYFLIGIEPEPEHFKMMQDHFRNNRINPDNYKLINAAITDHEGEVDFATGYSHEWWGQKIVRNTEEKIKWYDNAEIKSVEAITLASLLRGHPFVDFIDMDIQGEEYKVLSHSQKEIQHKVKRIHIGTHGKSIEQKLERMFHELNWICEFNYPCNSELNTEFGRVSFQDGVQVWKNKNFT